MSLLLDDRRTVRRASSETVLDQQLMQFSQRRQPNPRRTQFHSAAGDGIEHPGRHHDNDTGRDLDVNDFAVGAPLGILAADATPI